MRARLHSELYNIKGSNFTRISKIENELRSLSVSVGTPKAQNIRCSFTGARSLHLKSSSSRPSSCRIRLTKLLVKLRLCTIETLRPHSQLQPISSPLPDPQSHFPNGALLHASTDVLHHSSALRMQGQRQHLPNVIPSTARDS